MKRISRQIQRLRPRVPAILDIPTIEITSADLTFGLDPNWKTPPTTESGGTR